MILNHEVTDFQIKSMTSYNEEVITSRALPDVRDGLKPVQRRIMYTLDNIGAYSTKKFVKSARIVGNTMGDYHPHGDSSVYEAMDVMIQNFTNNQPMIEGHGSFSNALNLTPAAMRYTEARMSTFGEKYIMAGIRDNIVNFKPTFDNETEEPEVLPAQLPVVLVNGTMGIASGGFSTSIPSHSLESVVNSTIALLKDPKTSVETLITEHGLKPSFPNGGDVYVDDLVQVYMTGQGNIINQARITVDEESSGRYDYLTVHSLPYGVYLPKVVTSIKMLHASDKIKGLKDIKEFTKNGKIELQLVFSKGQNLKAIINQLYGSTGLRVTVVYNPNLMKGDTLVEYKDIRDIIFEWIDFRRTTLKRMKQNEIRTLTYRVHILEALIKLTVGDELDRLIAIIKNGTSREELKQVIRKEFNLTENQTEYLLDARLYSISKNEHDRFVAEHKEKSEKITEITKILKDIKLIDKLIIGELNTILKDKKIQRTDILPTEYPVAKLEEDTEESLIPDVQHMLIFTANGYVKKVEYTGPKTQKRNGKGVQVGTIKSDDSIISAFTASARDTVYLFTDQGYVFKSIVNDLPATKKITNLGVTIKPLIKGQNLVAVTTLTPEETKEEKTFLVATKLNKIKRIKLDQNQKVTAGGLLITKLNADDRIQSIDLLENPTGEVISLTSAGQALRMNLDQIPLYERSSLGANHFKFKAGSEATVVGSYELTSADKYLFLLTSDGYGKVVELAEFPDGATRYTMGVQAIGLREGTVVYARPLSEEDYQTGAISILTTSSVITMELKQVAVYKRPAKGLSLKKLDADETVVTAYVV